MLALCLLIPLALLAASCGSNSDSTTPEDTDPQNPESQVNQSDAIAISAGGGHSCALHQTGNISCWGNNIFGALGDGTGGEENYGLVPVGVVGISDATAISAGGGHSCALHQTGNISCWGYNGRGQLGNGTGGNQEDYTSVPMKVDGINDAIAVSTGGEHSCALHQNSNISCWGDNSKGQLGSSTGGSEEDYSSVPVRVQDIDDAIAISASWAHSCALHQTGQISCWGRNSNGELGDGTGGTESDYSSLPLRVEGISDAIAISAGSAHSCALHQTGQISCWGFNSYGALGDSTGGDEEDYSSVPVRVQDIDDATAVSAGGGHSCALHQTGQISCWGGNDDGQLGDSTWRGGWGVRSTNFSSVPVRTEGIDDAKAISAGLIHSCALHRNSTVSCWGSNRVGQLGDGTKGDEDNYSALPVGVVGIGDAIAVGAGGRHSCALRQTGGISCWGVNWSGLLGDGTERVTVIDFSSVPVGIKDISNATAIATGYDHSCALLQDSTITCWGDNSDGQLGNGLGGDEDEYNSVPVDVIGISDATAVSAGGGHSCALHQTGNISCWGKNSGGQLGNGLGGGENDYRSVPVDVVGISDATAISAGGLHSCALHQTGNISCWGNNYYGQMGTPDRIYRSEPTVIEGISDAIAISAGNYHSCALHQNSTISCWGRNDFGQLGDGTSSDFRDYSSMPVSVVGIDDAIAVSTVGAHSCALHQNSTISCWGDNGDGRLGDGAGGNEGDYSSLPLRVKGIDDAITASAGSSHSCALHQDNTISCWGDNTYGQLGDGSLLPKLVVGFGG